MSSTSAPSNSPNNSPPPGLRDPNRRVMVNNVNKEHVSWLKYGAETNGEYSQARAVVKPGGGVPFHKHLSYSETFCALDGDVTVSVGDDQVITLKPGDAVTAPIGVKHRFFNKGDEDVVFEVTMRPAHEGFEKSLYLIYGLANDGLTDKDSKPKSFVHLCLVTHMGDLRFPGLFGTMVSLVTGLGAAWGRWTGEEERLVRRYWGEG